MFKQQQEVQRVGLEPPRTVAARRLVLVIELAALLGSSSIAQGNLKSRLMPITAPLKHAGIYHVPTGTWTRNASLSNVTGPDIIYNNTCAPVYFAGMLQGELVQHRSCVPSPSHPVVPSIFYATGNDEAPGCHSSYLVNGFEFSYCSNRQAPVDFVQQFASSYTDCAASDMVPSVTFNITGLPGGTSSGGLACWIVDIDLSAGGLSFTLQGDGDGSYAGPVSQEQFGWSFGPTNGDSIFGTGPVIAGDFTWTGGSHTGPLVPCRGTDGTIWDSPVNPLEAGTGMASNDFFRSTGVSHGVSPGCYNFGGKPHGDFYLELFASAGCPSSPMTSFCDPGQGGVIPCPCSNPPAGSGSGCNNSSHTGGARLSATGTASLTTDTLVFGTEGERPTATSLVFQGTSSLTAGVVYGQGVRCVGGSVKRLYVKIASGGAITAPQAGDPSVSARSGQLGDPLSPGQTRYYGVYYRDPVVQGGCPAASTFNITQSGSVLWAP